MALKSGEVLSITEALPDPHYQSRSQLRKLTQTIGYEEQGCTGNWIAFTINFVKPLA